VYLVAFKEGADGHFGEQQAKTGDSPVFSLILIGREASERKGKQMAMRSPSAFLMQPSLSSS
jgi:hypothetical protein